MYEYKCKILRVVDGDTVDVDLRTGIRRVRNSNMGEINVRI